MHASPPRSDGSPWGPSDPPRGNAPAPRGGAASPPRALDPTASRPDPLHWAERAACTGHDPAIFHPQGRSRDRASAIQRAKAVCFGCPVWRDCLDYALDHDIDEGVWGGLRAQERAADLSLRRPGKCPRGVTAGTG
ncbi:WhiB family transcriptional regulator [Phycicoccus sp. MAQZ13P-2]|uniref:WhiB family transcriptional regulator n=1 Tax=Phycicoccus mangrovi TaxID=2840470 RepID=UPI001C001085|nr:WhiB family transcriptional regulator [Phycicoccus mangrovi]MBT9276359.1 WhiB family transcriptional regulator [Phycicoccus mangrovi]